MKKYFLFISICCITILSKAQIDNNSQWTWIKGDNIPSEGSYHIAPGARYGGVSWTDSSGNLWLFGGRGYSDFTGSFRVNLNDLWKFNLAANKWSLMKDGEFAYGAYGMLGVPASSNNPPGRYESVSWIDGLGQLWLFGGGNYYPISGTFSDFNDLWKFDININMWT